ncbi:hypothetical protein V2J09_015963 [Rumex salicifolius]
MPLTILALVLKCLIHSKVSPLKRPDLFLIRETFRSAAGTTTAQFNHIGSLIERLGISIFCQGEVSFFCSEDLQKSAAANGVDLISRGAEITVDSANRKYVIGGSEDEFPLSIKVKIFDEVSGKLNPTILGKQPTPGQDYWAVLLDANRILVIKNDPHIDDPIWFLEVDTEFVRRQSNVLGNVVVAWSKGVFGYAGKPIVISGPSGVGKGTLISKLMKEFPDKFGFSVSHTTRAPREKEVKGFHYHFTDRTTMETHIREGRFLETAEVHGNLYGTSIEAVETVEDTGKRCILDIDVQGAKSVRDSSLEATFIFISPPSLEDLKNRLLARGTETEAQIQKRLGNAKGEMEQGKTFGIFDHILINDNLESCYERLKELLGLKGSAENAQIQITARLFTSNQFSIKDRPNNLPKLWSCRRNHVKERVCSRSLLAQRRSANKDERDRSALCEPVGRFHSADQTTIQLTISLTVSFFDFYNAEFV